MAVLLVPTSEGVELRHDLAGAGSRFVAGLLDFALLAIAYLFVLLVVLVPVSFDPSGVSRFVLGLLLGGALLAVVGYQAFFHIAFAGQTPGKKATGIRVLSADGLPGTPMQNVLRALLLPIDALLFVPVPLGLMVIAATSKHQRLGDLFAKTLVVRAPRRAAEEDPLGGRTWSTLPFKKLPLTIGAAAHLGAEDRAFLHDLIVRKDLDPDRRRELFVAAAQHYVRRLGLGTFEDARDVVYELYAFAREQAAAGPS